MVATKERLKEEEKERIINDFLPFIKYTAYRLTWRLPPQLTVQDLISVGVMGLLDALGRYKDNGVKLSTFAEYRIRGAMLDELRAHDWIPKNVKKKIDSVKSAYLTLERELGRSPEGEEVAERLEIPLNEYYRILQSANVKVSVRFEDFGDRANDENGLDVIECISDPDAKTPLEICEENRKKEALARVISELPEKEQIILSLYYWEEMTMKEIGNVMNLTEGRVSQIHNQALMRLKAKVDL
ncbi:MAG TPA: FliA/WhiG family RNA polymerase sigma factor [Thermodesulfovibrionales bacterium]|jgi:RNA polymerase sigma factor for flagellar operon FliA|nr:FliA/WhiG family RNA polymerase sigma factor [Thermodesulfovibrionales bacterium]